jgi:hypothetical protein
MSKPAAASGRRPWQRVAFVLLPDLCRTNKSHTASLFGEKSPYVRYHRAPRPLSVTESFALPPRPEAVNMSHVNKFNIREWLVPPILLPIFLVLLVAAAMLIQW